MLHNTEDKCIEIVWVVTLQSGNVSNSLVV